MTVTTNNLRVFAAAALALRAAAGAAQAPFELDVSFRTQIDEIYVSSIAILSNDQILASGMVSFNGSSQVHGCVRLHPDGATDTAFPAFPFSYGGAKITPWNDRFYVAGGPPRRLSPLGLVDNSFQSLNTNLEFSSGQNGDYHVYPDGSVVITGSHTMNVPDSGWVGSHHMIWFNNDGTLDFTRRPRRGNGTISLIVPQPDGKFLLSGAATAWEGVPKPNIFRVHADGTLDTSFTCEMGWGEAASMTVIDDGRILVSGLFKTQFSSPDTLHFVRLMPNGDLDPTFNNDLEVVRSTWLPPLWPGNPIHWGQFALPNHKLLSDGRIVLYGSHYNVDGQDRLGVAMLDADGNLLDEPFGSSVCGRYYYEPFGFLYGDVYGFLEAPDGSFYIWGGYKGYDDGTTNDPTQRFISRLHGLNVDVAEWERMSFKLYPNPASTQVTVELEELPANGELLLRDALGREVLRQRVSAYHNNVGLQGLGGGVYLLELWAKGQRVGSERVVVE
ncbi:MAG: T9SS type A sorting domain-containing protein [Flavobacteriales bacterium]